MKRRVLAATMAVTMGITMMLTGCGSSSSDATANEEPITITYTQWQQEFSTAAIALADAYHEEHPNITVNVITQSDGYTSAGCV